MTTIYQTPTEASRKTGLSRAYICRLAVAGRIAGAVRIGKAWAIPADWMPPALKRGNPKFSKKGDQDAG